MQEVAKATTCVVVGATSDVQALGLDRYQSILWIGGRAPAAGAARAGPRIEFVPIEGVTFPDVGPILERFLRINPRQAPSLYVGDGVLGDRAPAYQHVLDVVHHHIEGALRARVTRQQEGFTWQRHLLANATAYMRQRVPDSWAGALRGLPALVCGSGPSLDVTLPLVVKHAGGCVLLAADSALHALARHGVRADFAVSIDAAKIPSKCLPNDCPPDRVILSSVSPPTWLNALPVTRIFFVSGHQITDDWLARHGIARTAVGSSESCGSTALDLAWFLGCDPIYLFGLDLAVDASDQARRHQSHADPALYRQSNYDPTAKLPRVPGNYADRVPCFALGDWHALNARLPERQNTRIFNVNDRGARLNGTVVIHPDRFSPADLSPDKSSALGRLSPATEIDPAVLEANLLRLRSCGQLFFGKVPELRAALQQGGPNELAPLLRSLLAETDCTRTLGAFALKLMPHLVPPIEGNADFWTRLIDELEELASIAAQCTLSAR